VISIHPSVITRLAIGFGLLLAISFVVLATVFYRGTIGVLNQSTDHKIASISSRLRADFRGHQYEQLANSIRIELSDGIDSDSELYLAIAGSGARIAGNLQTVPEPVAAMGQLVTRDVSRNGQSHRARLLAAPLSDGGVLIVGHDLNEQEAIQALVWEALATGGGTSMVLGVIGAFLFRRQIIGRISEIRLTAKGIEAGDLSRRIPVSGDDEFGLLNRDINRMLDRIEQLMNGVRHVSNAIAHDLRTPLSRVRARLDDALRSDASLDSLVDASQSSIAEIDELILLFDKLLYIAEAESGMRDQVFSRVDLGLIATDMVELYDATAEDRGMLLEKIPGPAVYGHGDRNLLASAVASLIDNAIKYAGPTATVRVSAFQLEGAATIEVRDNGQGIPQSELHRVTERFYRLDRSRSLPGNGLGLAIVEAIATFHGGALTLIDDGGLVARISLTRKS
jgi:signal transduction histidine kinase